MSLLTSLSFGMTVYVAVVRHDCFWFRFWLVVRVSLYCVALHCMYCIVLHCIVLYGCVVCFIVLRCFALLWFARHVHLQVEQKQANLQFFGSSSARFGSESRRLRTASGAPGPGAYPVASSFSKRNAANNNAATAGAAAVGGGNQEPTGVGFTGSASRFQVRA